MKAHIVVGANFGDEGKGQITQFLCHQNSNKIVVRHNGGAQAAHTVVDKKGTRFVFHHFGSGTNLGVPTYLSEYFICNPKVFEEEFENLRIMGIPTPEVYINTNSLLSIPYDWLLNRSAENTKGHNRLGSCGLGINETVTRCTHEEYKTVVQDLFDIQGLKNKIQRIVREYLPERVSKLNLEISDFENLSMDRFIQDCVRMLHKILTVEKTTILLNKFDNLIFEGAQGLLLDEDHKYYPHVTRSKTGSGNAFKILENTNCTDVDVYYVTRTYLTRHGAGPLPNEMNLGSLINDVTNTPNAYQGHLRVAPLNLDLMLEAIELDLQEQPLDYNININCAVTWYNNNPFNGEWIEDKRTYHGDILQKLKNMFADKVFAFSTPFSHISPLELI